jgi:hypothetical protein
MVPLKAAALMIDPSPPAAAARSALARLRGGEIDLEGYLDHAVLEVTGHLRGLPAHQLEEVPSALGERLRSDPASSSTS